MYFAGPHVSIAGGLENAPRNAKSVGATGFGMFVKNQRQWTAPFPRKDEVAAFKAALSENGFSPESVLPHAGYLINLANPDDAKQKQSLGSLIHELKVCDAIGIHRLNMHPGSSLKLITTEQACARVAEAINEAVAETERTVVVLENTAGSGGNIGSRFEELAQILEKVEDSSRIGVCIDTMHAFGAGYDLRTPESVAKVFDEFDRIVGFRWLKGMHLNDSMVDLASHRDRHDSLGTGKIGWAPFEYIMTDKRFENIPLVLETPHPDIWPEEVAKLLALARV